MFDTSLLLHIDYFSISHFFHTQYNVLRQNRYYAINITTQ